MTVADIIKIEPQSKTIFQTFGLDYKVYFNDDFEEVCKRIDTNPTLIREALLNMRTSLKSSHESFGQIIEDILKQHNGIKKTISNIHHTLLTLEGQTTRHNDLHAVRAKVEKLIENLELHLYKEEAILFPEFINLWNKKCGKTGYALPFRLMYPIETLENEHELVKSILREIRDVICHYKIRTNTNRHYQSVFTKLESLEIKLMELIDLEDQILFPKTLALEKLFIND